MVLKSLLKNAADLSARFGCAKKHELSSALSTHTPKLTLIRFCRTLLSAVGGLSGQAHLPARLPPAAAKKYRLVNVKRASIREQSDRTVVVFPFSPGVASPSFNFNLPLTHRTCSEERGWESANGTGSARCARGTNEGAGSAHVVLVRRQALSSATLL